MLILSKISKIVFISLFFIFVFGLFSVEIRDPDFWWHLKTGEYIYQTKSLPDTDPFSYTSLSNLSKDSVNPESKRIRFILSQYWLAQLIFFGIYKTFGFQGIIFLRAAILALLIFLIYRAVRREGAGIYLSLIFLVPSIVIFYTFTGERPQLFSFLFSFLIIYLLEGFRKITFKQNMQTTPDVVVSSNDVMTTNHSLKLKKRASRYKLFAIPFIMLLWANLHGGFIIGIVIIFGYIFSELIKFSARRLGQQLDAEALKLLIMTGIISIFLSLINPNSYNVLPFLIKFQTGLYKTMIIESASPVKLISAGFYKPQLITYFILLFANFLLILSNIKKLDITDMLLLCGLFLVSLSSSRFIPFFAPFSTLLIARYSSRIIPAFPLKEKIDIFKKRFDAPLLIILSLVLILVINNSDLFKSGIRHNKYPEGAAKFLKENKISGNMFNPYTWGGYLIWALYPEYKVFTDGRGLVEEVFLQQRKIMEAYQKKSSGLPEWKVYLNGYNINYIITFSVGNFSGRLVPLIPALLNDSEWHLVYMDNISLIFVRETPENKEIINRFGLPKEWLWNEVAVEAALKSKDYKNNINFYITIGDAFVAKKSYQDAKTAYLKAKEIEPKSSIVNLRLEILKAYGY